MPNGTSTATVSPCSTTDRGNGTARSIKLLGHEVDNREIEALFPAGAKYFSLLRSVQTGCWVHTASYPLVTEHSFRGCKAGT